MSVASGRVLPPATSRKNSNPGYNKENNPSVSAVTRGTLDTQASREMHFDGIHCADYTEIPVWSCDSEDLRNRHRRVRQWTDTGVEGVPHRYRSHPPFHRRA